MSVTAMEFHQRVRRGDSACFLAQGYQALKIIYEEEGLPTAALKGVVSLAASGYTTLSAVWEEMGVYYSFKEMYEQGHFIGRQLGDGGGWGPLALLDLMGLKYFLNASVAEANFLGLKKICQKFFDEHLIDPDVAYEILYNRMTELNADGIFQKCVASRILLALEIVGKPTAEQLLQYPDSKWVLDAELEVNYHQIEDQWKRQNYLHRLGEGFKVSQEKWGIRGTITAVTMGVLAPLTLTAAAVGSLIGEVKLGQQVIGEKDDLPAYGHLGEWLSNAVVNLTAGSFYCHRNFLLNPGNVSILAKIISQELQAANVAQDARYYDRLCDVGYQELEERGSKMKELFFELKLHHKNPPPLDEMKV